jgi:MraZ protein
MYSAQGVSLKGDKERFVLPPALRHAVAAPGEEKQVLIAKHDRWPCLIGYGESRKAHLWAQIDREEDMAVRRGEPFDRELRQFQLFDSTPVAFDTSGRFIIPSHLREQAGIEAAIYFQGAGPFFTIWSPDVLAAQDGPQWASAQANCRALLAAAPKVRK